MRPVTVLRQYYRQEQQGSQCADNSRPCRQVESKGCVETDEAPQCRDHPANGQTRHDGIDQETRTHGWHDKVGEHQQNTTDVHETRYNQAE